MANLITGFSINQSGLTPDAVNISFSGQQLVVEGPAVSQGGFTLGSGADKDVVTTTATKSVYLYIINKSTSAGGSVTLRDTANAFARLAPGEWAFLPIDHSTTLNVLEVGAKSTDIEYCYFTRT
jgi:hypothetical protein